MTKNLTNVVYIKQNRVLTDSRHLAEVFGKQHFHVLRTIEEQLKEIPEEFNASNFGLVDFLDAKGEKRPMYELTYDAFNLIAMSFTGKKALFYKVEYIKEFNRRGEELEKRGLPTYSTEELLEMSLAEIKKVKAELNVANTKITTMHDNVATIADIHLKPMAVWIREFPTLYKKGMELQTRNRSSLGPAACLTLYVKRILGIEPLQRKLKKGINTACQYDRATILKLIKLIEEGEN